MRLMSQCLWVYNIFCGSIFCAYIYRLSGLPPRFDLQLLVGLLPLRAYDDLRLPFCEALCSIALQTDYVNRHCSMQHEMHNNGT
jgi:hypothetical protein